MIKKTIYCFENNAYYTESLEKPNKEFFTRIRLYAEPKKALTKDQIDFHSMITVDESDLLDWQEVDRPDSLDEDINI